MPTDDSEFIRAAMKRLELDTQYKVYPHLMLLDEIDRQNEEFLSEYEKDPQKMMQRLRTQLALTINDPESRLSPADIHSLYYALHGSPADMALFAKRLLDYDGPERVAHHNVRLWMTAGKRNLMSESAYLMRAVKPLMPFGINEQFEWYNNKAIRTAKYAARESACTPETVYDMQMNMARLPNIFADPAKGEAVSQQVREFLRTDAVRDILGVTTVDIDSQQLEAAFKLIVARIEQLEADIKVWSPETADFPPGYPDNFPPEPTKDLRRRKRQRGRRQCRQLIHEAVTGSDPDSTIAPTPVCAATVESPMTPPEETHEDTKYNNMAVTNTTILGGDLSTSLSNNEINAIMEKIARAHSDTTIVLPSETAITTPNISSTIRSASTANKRIIFVFWSRYHWVLVCVKDKTATAYDSAPSQGVQSDLTRFCSNNGLRLVLQKCPRQFRTTEECGLFAIGFATLLMNNITPANHDRAVSLKHIRDILKENRVPTPEDFRALSDNITAGGRNWEALYNKYEVHHRNKGLARVFIATILTNAAREHASGHTMLPVTTVALSNLRQRFSDPDVSLESILDIMRIDGDLPAQSVCQSASRKMVTDNGNNIAVITSDNNRPVSIPPGWRALLFATDSQRCVLSKASGTTALIVRDPTASAPQRIVWWRPPDDAAAIYALGDTTNEGERVTAELCECGGWRKAIDNNYFIKPQSDDEMRPIGTLQANIDSCTCARGTRFTGGPGRTAPTTTPTTNDESDEANTAPAADPDDIDAIRQEWPDEDRTPLNYEPKSNARLAGKAGVHWHIYDNKPPHVHQGAWNAKAKTTRDAQREALKLIKAMPTNLHRTPLHTAVIDLIFRLATQRKWAWSTIATKISTAATALRDLPLYTNETDGIDIRQSPAFIMTMQRAQKLARLHAAEPDVIAKPMPHETFTRISESNIASPVRLLLALSWYFAARVGDMRQIKPAHVQLPPNNCPNEPTTITFTAGKGGAFWGPYTIAAVIPHQIARDLSGLIQERANQATLWSDSEQRALSRIVAELEMGLTLPSIRRGAVLHNAERGATDEQIMLLTGHKRKDTLMRYLQWGKYSSTARDAAIARDQNTRVEVDGAGPGGPPNNNTTMEPRKMGPHSGQNTSDGKRISKPPNFFWERPPSSNELNGLKYGPSDLPLHIKNVSKINWDAMIEIASTTRFAEEVVEAKKWLTPEKYDGLELSHGRKPIFRAKFNNNQIRQLWESGRLDPVSDPAQLKAFVNLFGRDEVDRGRQRVLGEPWINRILCDVPKLNYPSRLQRRATILNKKFVIQFDMAAFYDQFEFLDDANNFFGVITHPFVRPDNGETVTHWRVTRLPMGAKFSTAVAQSATWALCDAAQKRSTKITTMIDNVRIASDDQNDFVQSVRTFLANVAKANITLNEQTDGWTDNDIINLGIKGSTEDFTFLGETYVGNTVRNTDKLIKKLTTATQNMKNGSTTRRNMAAIVGLALYMAHTININLAAHGDLIKAYANLFRGTPEWDEPLEYIDESLLAKLNRIIGPILQNTPVTIKAPTPPPTTDDEYDATLIIDACQTSWGARLRLAKTGQTFQLLKAFIFPVQHSAHAEPQAVTEALRWMKQTHPDIKSLALVTDHEAIPNGQKRWWSGYAGFSTSFYLNEAFAEMHNYAQAFHVKGDDNIADADSRSPEAAAARTITVNEIQMVWPELTGFNHPYAHNTQAKGF